MLDDLLVRGQGKGGGKGEEGREGTRMERRGWAASFHELPRYCEVFVLPLQSIAAAFHVCLFVCAGRRVVVALARWRSGGIGVLVAGG